MNLTKIAYFITTGLLTLLMLFSVQMYVLNYDSITGAFNQLGFPSWMVYPLATLKVLGLIAIWSRLSAFLKEWAYAGFFFDTVAAAAAHGIAADGGGLFAQVGIVLVITSYIADGKTFGNAAFNKET